MSKASEEWGKKTGLTCGVVAEKMKEAFAAHGGTPLRPMENPEMHAMWPTWCVAYMEGFCLCQRAWKQSLKPAPEAAGMYQCVCVDCGRTFLSENRRAVVCGCAAPEAAEGGKG